VDAPRRNSKWCRKLYHDGIDGKMWMLLEEIQNGAVSAVKSWKGQLSVKRQFMPIDLNKICLNQRPVVRRLPGQARSETGRDTLH
jgi:hypothetical protein